MLTLEAATEEAQEGIGGCLATALGGDGCVIHLRGDLGAGKTTLVRGFLRALGHGGAVKSPTYTLMEPYRLGGRDVLHLDLYRLVDAAELEYLGIPELTDPQRVWLVEWPERGGAGLPAADLVVWIAYHGRGRRLTLVAHSDAGRELLSVVSGQSAQGVGWSSRKIL
jgi:tRNA threonylcarbamoyladenosine biosynthesis protein TsaE